MSLGNQGEKEVRVRVFPLAVTSNPSNSYDYELKINAHLSLNWRRCRMMHNKSDILINIQLYELNYEITHQNRIIPHGYILWLVLDLVGDYVGRNHMIPCHC